MVLLLLSICLLAGSGLAALAFTNYPRASTVIGSIGAMAGSIVGLISALRVLYGLPALTLRYSWNVPYGSFFIELDAISAFFMIPLLSLSALAACYGSGYMPSFRGRKWMGPPWFFYNLLVASMMLVLISRNALLFLVAWEVMSLTSFFLVTFENEKEKVRQAGWIYLAASHLGVAFLLAMFLMLGRESGSLDFDHLRLATNAGLANASIIFLMAIIGFGTKAGFMPFHVWLPEAHPAAPSHVSAIMSGVMIKLGIYGLVRILAFLGPPPVWWGGLLIAIGLTSGILGVLFALAQHDVKRLLAYHSVENIGIIALGLGVGVVGMSLHNAPLMVLGLGGGLLHVLNHAIFKGLLFLGAGSVLHATHTGEIDQMGGLLKRMPWTGVTFLIGSLAISGLPPFNGFISELLIYLGALTSIRTPGTMQMAVGLSVIAGLALIGGLAAACFTKAFGVIFLGEPRVERLQHVHESRPSMLVPMVLLAMGCVFVGLCSPLLMKPMGPVLQGITGMTDEAIADQLIGPVELLWSITLASAVLIVLILVLALLRRRLLLGRSVERTVTWDCGYARPTARMQYSASSFAQPLTGMFQMFLRTHARVTEPDGLFPKSGSFASETLDVCQNYFYRPLFNGLCWVFMKMRWIQHGRVQIYVLYIAVTLLILLIWKLG